MSKSLPPTPSREQRHEKAAHRQTQSLEARLEHEAKSLREEAKVLPPGARREALLRKARQHEITANMTE
nr:hypothetical protein [Bradyrhizobium ivorense]